MFLRLFWVTPRMMMTSGRGTEGTKGTEGTGVGIGFFGFGAGGGLHGLVRTNEGEAGGGRKGALFWGRVPDLWEGYFEPAESFLMRGGVRVGEFEDGGSGLRGDGGDDGGGDFGGGGEVEGVGELGFPDDVASGVRVGGDAELDEVFRPSDEELEGVGFACFGRGAEGVFDEVGFAVEVGVGVGGGVGGEGEGLAGGPGGEGVGDGDLEGGGGGLVVEVGGGEGDGGGAGEEGGEGEVGAG